MTPTGLDRDQLLDARPVNGHGGVGERVRRMRGSWALRLLGVVLIAAAAGWAYYTNVTTAKPAMDMNMRISAGDTAFPVTVAPAERGAVSGAVTYSGNVVPFNEEDVYPRVTGRLVDIPVYPGDAVRAGQVVARLDDVELMSRVHEADAMAATAQANRAQMDADVLAARHGIAQMERELAMVDAESAYAAGVLRRSERLVASGAIARQEYENDRAMAASLAAKREAAQAKLEQARAMETSARKKVEAADAMVAQSRAASRTAQIVRDYVTITTRSSGYVVKRLVAPGVLVQPGMAILKIAQIDRVRLQANVGEKDVASIRVGSPIIVTTAGGQNVPAKVTSVFPFVDQGPRTAVVEAIVENPARTLLPGQYVTMRFATGGRADALTVPRSAVTRMGGKAKVWSVRDGRAEPRDVTLGIEGADRVEVTAGLTAGEAVVVRGLEGLYAGAHVSADSMPAPKGEPTDGGHSGHAAEPPAPKATPHGGGHAGH
jgi:multidrug efflux pump subunit AcrA (membrane-fusion protein)